MLIALRWSYTRSGRPGSKAQGEKTKKPRRTAFPGGLYQPHTQGLLCRQGHEDERPFLLDILTTPGLKPKLPKARRGDVFPQLRRHGFLLALRHEHVTTPQKCYTLPELGFFDPATPDIGSIRRHHPKPVGIRDAKRLVASLHLAHPRPQTGACKDTQGVIIHSKL